MAPMVDFSERCSQRQTILPRLCMSSALEKQCENCVQAFSITACISETTDGEEQCVRSQLEYSDPIGRGERSRTEKEVLTTSVMMFD